MESDKENKPDKKNIFLNILIIIFTISLIISALYITKWFIDSKQNKRIADKVKEAIIDSGDTGEYMEYEVDFEKLKEINDEIVAYLKVYGTQVEYAVVQAKDNNYYLKRNLEKTYNVGGWIFLDYHNKLDGTDKNIVVYGHNMQDNSMFGSLKNILNEEWYNNEENCIIDFKTEKEAQKYQVFSVYKIEAEDYYIETEFSENEFLQFIQTLKNRSIKNFNIDVSAEDSILTLSTCGASSKYRIVLHAKKL